MFWPWHNCWSGWFENVWNCQDTPRFTFLGSLPPSVKYHPNETWVGTGTVLEDWTIHTYHQKCVSFQNHLQYPWFLFPFRKILSLGCIPPILVERWKKNDGCSSKNLKTNTFSPSVARWVQHILGKGWKNYHFYITPCESPGHWSSPLQPG